MPFDGPTDAQPVDSSSDARFEEAFRTERHALVVERARFLLKSAIVLYPAFWFLDLISAPEKAFAFLQIRAAVVVLYGITLWFSYRPAGERLIGPLTMGYIFASALGISVMAASLGGFQSDYYVGMMIVIFVVGFFMPWRLRDSAALCALMLGAYFAINTPIYGLSRDAISPAFFLAGTSVFSCLATIAAERSGRQDFKNRQKLEKANDDLKTLDESKTRFFANVSHELRTPLTLILGPAAQLLSEETEPGRRAVLEAMGANARRLLRQVNTLLDVAKLEAGRLRLDIGDQNLGRLLADLVAAAAPHAARRGLTLVGEGLEAIPDSRFDRDKMEAVAANLLSNALKFTPPGGRVAVRAAVDGERLRFTVADTGPGIAPEDQPKLFERFYRVEQGEGAAAGATEGTGLGLSLARELARLHGGDIAVASEAGKGATFTVEFPIEVKDLYADRRKGMRRREDQLAAMRLEALAQRQLDAARKRETMLADVETPVLGRAALPPQPEPPPDARRVLLVEDNEDLRAFVAHRLARRWRVETAADGQAGLEAAMRLPRPDLIVSDVMMPRMDGHELCRRLRADPDLRQIPFILVTAKAGAEAAVEGLDTGADDYVTKPFDMRELEARIEAHLRARALERNLAERDTRLAAIGRMTSTIVHDLKNPLTSVSGFAELAQQSLLEGGDPKQAAEDLERVLDGAQRLKKMIQEVLEFAREGAQSLRPEPTPVVPWMETVLQPMECTLKGDGIALDRDLAMDRAVGAEIDTERARRVIENLVTNAREALVSERNAGRERRISVRMRADGGALTIRIADTGPGIPDDVVPRLFEPFATAGKKSGTGLGLATVRNLVKAHGGDVAAEPHGTEGGAAFTIRLPLAWDHGSGSGRIDKRVAAVGAGK